MPKTSTPALITAAFMIVFAISACPSPPPPPGPVNITILHSNDTHSYLDLIARRATLVDQARTAAGKENVLLLDAGDVFSGTPYFTLYHGQADLWFLNQMQYDAMCVGNHDFDLKPEGLASFVKNANFPVLCANFDFSQEAALAGRIKPWVIVERSGGRFGIFGITSSETAELSQPGPNITIKDHIPAARQAVSELGSRGVNKIIGLTQIGWNNDLDLARQVSGIDLIVGGHSHTVANPYPTVVPSGNSTTLVVQTGWQNANLGSLKLKFDHNGAVQSWDGSQLIPITDTIAAEPVCAAKLAEYRKPVQALIEKTIGKALVVLDGERANIRTRETNLGNLIADALLQSANAVKPDFCLINGGSIRTSLPAGDISLGRLLIVMPFGSTTVALDLTGKQVLAALENGVSQVEQVAGRFPQVSGLRFTWDPRAPAGSRIRSIEIKSAVGYIPLDYSATYRAVTNNFVAAGGDGYDIFKEWKNPVYLGQVDSEIVAAYITANSPVNPVVEGRIKRL